MQFLKKNLLFALLSLVVIIMLVSLYLTKRNNQIITKNLALKHQAETIKETNSLILREVMHSIDLGLRGYAITKNENLLQPFRKAGKTNEEVFGDLEGQLKMQKYDLTELGHVRKEVENYLAFNQGMVDDIVNDRMDVFLQKLNMDKGFYAWKAWDDHTKKLIAYEDALIKGADEEVDRAMAQNLWLKLVLVVFSIPTFSLALFIVWRQNKKSKRLLLDLEMNNRKFLFDPGTDASRLTEPEILNASIENMRKTAFFLKSVAAGNYDNEWIGLNDTNIGLNEHNIAGELIQMQKQMKEVKLADERRLWSNEGLAKFSEVIRNNQGNLDGLVQFSVSFLTKHLKSWQACLYLRYVDSVSGDDYLIAGKQFASDGTKLRQERIYPGEGVVGQAMLDANPILIDNVSPEYWKLSSGLGSAVPSNVLIVPFQFNKRVNAVFEIASFSPFKPDEIEFLQKAGEYFASAISMYDAQELQEVSSK